MDDDFSFVVKERPESSESDSETENESGSESESDVSDEHLVKGVKQYEHMGQRDELYEDQVGDNLDYRTRLKLFGPISGEDRFRKTIKQYIHENDDFEGIVTPHFLSSITKLKHIEYKNPKAFLIAYYYITKSDSYKEFEKIVKRYIENGVSVEDVFRYVRMIKSL